PVRAVPAAGAGGRRGQHRERRRPDRVDRRGHRAHRRARLPDHVPPDGRRGAGVRRDGVRAPPPDSRDRRLRGRRARQQRHRGRGASRGRSDMTLDINARRLLDRVEAFGGIGRDPGGGISRAGFGAADLEARERLHEEARLGGLDSAVDAAGNVIVRRPGRPGPADRPVLLIGSHLDTVANGGRLDGAYGVLAGLDVMQTLAEHRVAPAREPGPVAFANEEGALFPQPFWGSKVLAGALDSLPADPRDHEGRSLRGPLARAGGDLAALGTAVWPAGSVAAYLELHVEQGPVLESGGHTIGVVDSITGRTQFAVEIRGAAGHAGTTPMELRRDPVTAAARVVLAAEEIARERRLCRVATV